jgi:nucleotide-binding universal stress UspA family protein
MAYRHILAGFDGSPPATAALLQAIELARCCGAALSIAAVARVPEYAATIDEVNGALEDARRHLQAALDRASTLARERGIAAEVHMLAGHPADALIRFAEQRGVDLIVVGARGLSTVQRLLLGSVSAALVRHAPCSVLVARGEPAPS